MRILALEPYYGGSHKTFLDGWGAHSRHEWTVLGLPPFKWKWRMRHSAYTLAEQVRERTSAGEQWDVLLCSEMLDLAAFYGLAPGELRALPSVAYFHENQLTYPVRNESERDYHFGYANMTTALAAARVWFNSAFNRDSFLEALPAFLKRMPDYQPLEAAERIRAKSEIQPQGVREMLQRGVREPGPLRILWAARWEHDKNPRLFFDALKELKAGRVDFRVSVVGQQFRDVPTVFAWAADYFRDHIDRWGYQETRTEYEAALLEADVVVSTADHEFFGVSVVEAIAAGALPVLPQRLAYPEILRNIDPANARLFFYEGGASELCGRLELLAERLEAGDLWQGDPQRGRRAVQHYTWPKLAPALDYALDAMYSGARHRQAGTRL
jgi:glycosyltransferase involved in cell wall biosynthesis